MQPNIPGALVENDPERPLCEQTEKAEYHYLRRWQIWAVDPTGQAPVQEWDDPQQRWGAPRIQYTWQPYDPSSVQPAPPREDIDNYFYVNIRYTKRDAEPEVVFSHFSSTLTDFLRMAIGDEFFESKPDSPLTHFVFKLDELKAHLSDACSALSNLSGEDLKKVAHDLGRLDSLTPQKTEKDAQQYLEDLINHLDIFIPLVEKEFEPIKETYYYEVSGDKGTKALSDLPCKIMQDDVHNELIERGRLYAAVSGIHFKSYDGRRVVIDQNGYCGRDPEFLRYLPSDIEVVTDVNSRYPVTSPPEPDYGDALSRPGSPYAGGNSCQEFLYVLTGARERYAHNDIREIPEDQLYLLPVNSWEKFDVRKLEEIHFDEQAWDHLVLNKATKDQPLTVDQALIKGLVDVTRTTNTSGQVFSDIITGKGGGLIALLHGPPGTGKTLTAEAVAEHLKRPLYVLSSLELSTTPATLEEKLGDILKLATTWDAVVLIDEADVFLEQRSLHELERNALVSVALRVLEYHRGVLFLTTNHIQAFDEAFLSRFSIAVKYSELDADARFIIWRKFFELAGCELWGGSGRPEDGQQSPDEFVKLEGQEPQCYVSLSDLKELAAKPFNGRTIKNLVRTAQALAMSLYGTSLYDVFCITYSCKFRDEPLSLEHIKVVVEAQEKFLTKFANVKL
ncbi:P-loop containing nucleoside triphosphate hydrolase protein [Suillus decipiens]|nr:P-loop containing nucleoside triphosphate hydrolase protein [Suillus decipiens]